MPGIGQRGMRGGQGGAAGDGKEAGGKGAVVTEVTINSLAQWLGRHGRSLFLPFLLVGLIACEDMSTRSPEVVTITLQYTEPSQNADGTPLRDLDHTTIYYDVGAGEVRAADVPASSPAGGGTITHKIIIPIAASKKEVTARIWVTGTDKSGNESTPSQVVSTRLGKTAPVAPQ